MSDEDSTNNDDGVYDEDEEEVEYEEESDNEREAKVWCSIIVYANSVCRAWHIPMSRI